MSTTTSSDGDATGGSDEAEVVIHWRPGCGFCAGLFRSIEGIDLTHDRRNIWEDEEAAAWVRSVANGNETVPTVRVGDIALVNPTARELVAAVAEHAPSSLPEGTELPDEGGVQRFVRRVLGG